MVVVDGGETNGSVGREVGLRGHGAGGEVCGTRAAHAARVRSKEGVTRYAGARAGRTGGPGVHVVTVSGGESLETAVRNAPLRQPQQVTLVGRHASDDEAAPEPDYLAQGALAAL